MGKTVFFRTMPLLAAVFLTGVPSAVRAEWAKPDFVAKVAKGEVSEARVSWWGFDKEDSTKYLKAAIGSGVKKLIVDRMESEWITTQLAAVSGQHIVFEPGTVLLAKRGEFKGRNDYLFTIENVQDVRITGYGAVFRMWREDYAKGPGYRRGEWRHLISLRGGRNITIEGLRLEDSGGDGISVSGVKGDREPPRDVVIRDCVCDRNHRQGISVISAKNLLIENCVFRNTRGTPPEDGIDIEPDKEWQRIENCVIRNCVSENNAGNGFEVALSRSRSSTPPCSVVFENCRSTGDRAGVKIRTRVKASEGDYPEGEIIFRGCTFEKTRFNAVEIQQNPENALSVSLDKCTFREIGTVDKAAPLTLLYSLYPDDPCPAMPRITGMDWPDRGGRALKAYDLENFAAIPGENTLPSMPVVTEGACVVDKSPGKHARSSALRIWNCARLVFYADSARRVKVRCEQSRVGRRERKAVGGMLKVLDSAGRTVGTVPRPGYNLTDLSFDAPAAGFYSMETDFKPNALNVYGANVPLAIDCTRSGKRNQPLFLFTSVGSLYVPVKKGQQAELRCRGQKPRSKVSFSVTDPDGKERFRDDSVLYWTRYQTPVAEKDGVWKMSFGKPADLSFYEIEIDVAGTVPLLFTSPEKFWYSGD